MHHAGPTEQLLSSVSGSVNQNVATVLNPVVISICCHSRRPPSSFRHNYTARGASRSLAEGTDNQEAPLERRTEGIISKVQTEAKYTT